MLSYFPLETSCQVNGVTFRERDVVRENCREVCRCLSGLVQCTNLCPDEDVVTEPSTTCPEPKLVRVEGDCCRTWKCFPEGMTDILVLLIYTDYEWLFATNKTKSGDGSAALILRLS